MNDGYFLRVFRSCFDDFDLPGDERFLKDNLAFAVLPDNNPTSLAIEALGACALTRA